MLENLFELPIMEAPSTSPEPEVYRREYKIKKGEMDFLVTLDTSKNAEIAARTLSSWTPVKYGLLRTYIRIQADEINIIVEQRRIFYNCTSLFTIDFPTMKSGPIEDSFWSMIEATIEQLDLIKNIVGFYK